MQLPCAEAAHVGGPTVGGRACQKTRPLPYGPLRGPAGGRRTIRKKGLHVRRCACRCQASRECAGGTWRSTRGCGVSSALAVFLVRRRRPLANAQGRQSLQTRSSSGHPSLHQWARVVLCPLRASRVRASFTSGHRRAHHPQLTSFCVVRRRANRQRSDAWVWHHSDVSCLIRTTREGFLMTILQ